MVRLMFLLFTRKQAKDVAGQQKLAAHQERERDKMREFRLMMGLPLEEDQ